LHRCFVGENNSIIAENVPHSHKPREDKRKSRQRKRRPKTIPFDISTIKFPVGQKRRKFARVFFCKIMNFKCRVSLIRAGAKEKTKFRF